MTKATTDNTAVVTIMQYKSKDVVPVTCNFMLASAKRFGIDVQIFGKGDTPVWLRPRVPDWHKMKVTELRQYVDSLSYHYEFVLYVDARDVLFVRPLDIICEDFNRLRWPIVMSCERYCHPHLDPGWHDRFPKHKSGFDFNSAGVWMAEREILTSALDELDRLATEVREDRIASSMKDLWTDDQHLWQAAYLEQTLPIRLDFDQVIFNTFGHMEFDEYDFSKSSNESPICLHNGSSPSIMHFAGKAGNALPYVAWLLQIVKPGTVPELEVWE